jgi:LPXTG-site transpeptidase (sortase) family protein
VPEQLDEWEADGVRGLLARLAELAPGREAPAEITLPGARTGVAQVRGALTWLTGPTLTTRFGSVLVGVGLLLVMYSLMAYLGWLPGGYTKIPDPIALADGRREAKLEAPALDGSTGQVANPRAQATPSVQARNPFAPAIRAAPTFVPAGPLAAARPTAAATPVAVAPPVGLKLDPADADDRRAAAVAPRPGAPVRLRIASVEIETEVREGGVIKDKDGQWEWETLPFIATSYPFLGPVGTIGNPVISGHVVTLREGNVFRDLYKVKLGDEIEVFTERAQFSYVVDEIKLVSPTAVEVLLPAGDARLTVLTCGGEFDPKSRTFSERLILVGKLAGGQRL